MTEQLLYDIGDILMSVATLGVLVFALSYGVFFRWRRTAAGRSLMYFVLALLAWAAQSTAARLFDGIYLGRAGLRIIVYTGILLTVWRLVYTLWRSWRHTPQPIEPRPTTKENPYVD